MPSDRVDSSSQSFLAISPKVAIPVPHVTAASNNVDAEGRVAESGVSGKCESIEVAHKANKLWQADLKLHEQWLKVA